MPTPTHSQPLPSELFTDREVSKKRFKENLDKPQLSAEYRILSWFGVGGQGKTALVEEFDRILKSKQATAQSIPPFAHALIDFENANNRAIATALLAIRGQLHATSGLHFPTFEFACLRYLALTQPDVDLKDLRTRFFTAGAPYLDSLLQAMFALGELGGAVHAIPGFSLITKYGTKLLGKAGQTFIDWWNDRGGRTLYDIDELSQNALLRRLPSYFGADLMDALARKRPPRIVIMLDTYEALWRGRGLRDGPGALRIDDWVRLLVQDSPGVMFIIFGRDKLRWHEIDPQARWNDVISEYLLGGLNRRDADALLIKWRVQESTIRIRMIAGSSSGESHTVDEQTEAYLPFYLELQALTYRNITAQGRVPRPEDFGSDQPQILARFLEHLDGESDKLLRVASYLSALDSEVLDMLSDKFLGGRASTDWSRLYGRSLISEERERGVSLCPQPVAKSAAETRAGRQTGVVSGHPSSVV